MALADGGLDGPNFGWRKHASKWRVLAQATVFLAITLKDTTDLAERSLQDRLPLAVAAHERRGISVLPQPTGEVVPSDLQQFGPFPQAGRYAAANLKTDLVIYFVPHN